MENRITLIAWVVLLLGGVAAAESPKPPEARPTTRPVALQGPAAVVVVRGTIDDSTKRALEKHFKQAKADGAKTVILDIDTYGGAVSAALEMSHFLKQNRDVYTIAYVNNKAYSAGALISLACHEIVMAPVAVIGDCAPIAVGQDGSMMNMNDEERGKAVSPIWKDFENSAQLNGHDPTLVLSMVSMKHVVHWVERADDPSQRRFVDAAAFATLTKDGAWRVVAMENVPNPIDGPDTLLTLYADVAKKIGLSKGTYASREALAADRGVSIARVYEPSMGETLVEWLAHPAARGLMIMVFMTCLYAALHAPGHGFAEVLCVITLSVAVGVPLMTGQAQWWEILLILGGVALLALEIFVLPGFGVAGIAGILAVVIGFIFTFVSPEPGKSSFSMPSLPMTWRGLQTGLTVLVSAMVCSIVLSAWLRRYLPKLPYFNRLILNTSVGSSATAMAGSLTNIDPSENLPRIGAKGVALTDLRPGGTARFEDSAGNVHTVSVVSDSGFVKRQTPVAVREIEGIRILVRAVPREEPA